MDKEFCQYLKVMSAILNYFVPHVHYKKVIVVVDESFADLVQLGEEFETFVVD